MICENPQTTADVKPASRFPLPASRGMTNPPSNTPIDSAAGDATAIVVRQKFVETLGLSFVVAEDDRRHPIAHETRELA